MLIVLRVDVLSTVARISARGIPRLLRGFPGLLCLALATTSAFLESYVRNRYLDESALAASLNLSALRSPLDLLLRVASQ